MQGQAGPLGRVTLTILYRSYRSYSAPAAPAGLLLPWEASAGVTVEHLLAFGGLATSLAAFCLAAVLLHR